MERYLELIQRLALALEETGLGSLAQFRRELQDAAADQAAILDIALYQKGVN